MFTLKNYNYAVDSITQISQSTHKEGDKIFVKKTNQIFVYDGKGKYTDIDHEDLRTPIINGIA